MPADFETKTNKGYIRYLVEVLSQKKKFDNGLSIRKVRVTRKVYEQEVSGFFVEEVKNSASPPIIKG